MIYVSVGGKVEFVELHQQELEGNQYGSVPNPPVLLGTLVIKDEQFDDPHIEVEVVGWKSAWLSAIRRTLAGNNWRISDTSNVSFRYLDGRELGLFTFVEMRHYTFDEILDLLPALVSVHSEYLKD